MRCRLNAGKFPWSWPLHPHTPARAFPNSRQIVLQLSHACCDKRRAASFHHRKVSERPVALDVADPVQPVLDAPVRAMSAARRSGGASAGLREGGRRHHAPALAQSADGTAPQGRRDPQHRPLRLPQAKRNRGRAADPPRPVTTARSGARPSEQPHDVQPKGPAGGLEHAHRIHDNSRETDRPPWVTTRVRKPQVSGSTI